MFQRLYLYDHENLFFFKLTIMKDNEKYKERLN